MSVDAFAIAEEVQAAVADGRPVVALESTVITHGLPYPDNLATAREMERAVREGGAVPATIAVLEGRVTVGMTDVELTRLATRPREAVRKCSRRDLAFAIARREDASTTVAGTILIAHKVGIHILATGGIGGVHRGHPFDVSADLVELGRTPVAVVCSGAKAILDLPLTLEVLETQGVPVIGFGTTELPAFYSQKSGLTLDARVDTADDAARVIATALRLELGHGVLIAVPVPVRDELPRDRAETAIARALEEATAQGVSGKAVTPFLLARVSELTEGESRRANLALLINNAHTAARIAVALVKLRS